MTLVIIIAALSCGGMVAVTLVKPKLTVRGASIGTYWLVTLFGAAAMVATGLISLTEVGKGLTANSAINPLKILVLFISMTALSIFLDETGFFRFMAGVVLKRAGGSQTKLFTAFYIMISILTVFTSNDIVILTFTPFICYFAKNAKVDPVPYLVSEFVAANTASMLFIIGNPTNIYLGTSAGIGFAEYLKIMALPTLFAVVTAYAVMFLIFRRRLRLPISGEAQPAKIEQKPLLIIGLALLLSCTALLVISSYVGIEMWIVALGGALCLALAVEIYSLIKKQKPTELVRTFRRAPWELVPFVISMFVIILALNKQGVTEKLADGLGAKHVELLYGGASVLFANLLNNIPMSVLFSSVIESLALLSPNAVLPATYAVIIGSNIGAFLTPIGALAGIMWLSILKDNNIHFSFVRFLKYGVIIAMPVLLAALCGLMIMI